MEEKKESNIKLMPSFNEECRHEFKRLFFVADIEDYGYAIHDAYVKKCFRCKLVIAEDA